MKKITYLLLFSFYFVCVGYGAQEGDNASASEHYRLGKIYYEHGLYPQAEEEFQKALQYAKTTPKTTATDQTITSAQIPVETTVTDKITPNNQQPILMGEYIIDKGDSLKITVWENPDLNQEVTVRPDGKISFPLTGEIIAKGKSIPELDRELTTRLSTYIRRPDVSVSLKEMGGNKIIVLGEVGRPGKYSLNDAPTVIEAIASAGGFGRDAIQNSIIVISGGLKHPKPRRVNVQDAIRGGKMEGNNIQLAAQDIVFVPRKFIADLNYIMMKLIEPLSSGAGTESTLKGL